MSVHNFNDFKAQKMFYVVYSEFASRVKIEYNMYSLQEAQEKAMEWSVSQANRKAVVYSITQKDPNPREEYAVSNQFVEGQTKEKAS